MFMQIVVGVDDHEGGRDAIALAKVLARPQSEITLAYVYCGDPRVYQGREKPPVVTDRERTLERIETLRHEVGIDADIRYVGATSPGRGLHELAEHQHADLLVVGSSSRGLVGRVLTGDDTRAALNGAPCAVAIAERGYSEHPTPIAKVGVAYNGSPESKLALECARELTAATRADIVALEVVAIPTYAYTGLMVPTAGGGLDEILADANKRMEEIDGVSGRAVYGLSGEELAAFGDEVDLLVVGSRSYGPVRRLVIGSTSDYLERHARCALLVLPRAGESEHAGESEIAQAPAGA